MTSKISIYRDGVWAGAGRIDADGEIECEALLGASQDDSDETYEAMADAIADEPVPYGSVTRPDGEYSWTLGD